MKPPKRPTYKACANGCGATIKDTGNNRYCKPCAWDVHKSREPNRNENKRRNRLAKNEGTENAT